MEMQIWLLQFSKLQFVTACVQCRWPRFNTLLWLGCLTPPESSLQIVFCAERTAKNTCFSLDGNDTSKSNCGGNNAHASVGVPNTSSYLCMCDNAQTKTNMKWHTHQKKLKHHIADSKTWLIFTMKCQRPSGPSKRSKRWTPSQRIAHWKI